MKLASQYEKQAGNECWKGPLHTGMSTGRTRRGS
jgi:hypothetical protein